MISLVYMVNETSKSKNESHMTVTNESHMTVLHLHCTAHQQGYLSKPMFTGVTKILLHVGFNTLTNYQVYIFGLI